MTDLSHHQFIDIHYHANPDLYRRRYSALDAGRQYQTLNGAVVLKSHLGSTTIHASLAQSKGLPVYASLVLNAIAGGMDYRVVLRALAEYNESSKLLVHFPTLTGRQYHSRLSRTLVHPYLEKQVLASETLFNEQQQLKKAAIDVLKMAKDYPIVLSTGHASKEETYRLIDYCAKYGVPDLFLNQPANPLTGLSAEELEAIANHSFVWIEQTLLTYLIGHQSKADLAKVLCSIPRVIYSSDLGQTSQMGIADWFRYSKRLFAELNLPVERQQELWRDNPIQLLKR